MSPKDIFGKQLDFNSFGYLTNDNTTGATNIGIPIEWNSNVSESRIGKLILQTIGSNIWIGNETFNNPTGRTFSFGSGTITLSNFLERVRITTITGTPTFSRGTVNISWEELNKRIII